MAAETEKPAEPDSPGGSESILLVEDQPDLRRILQRMLTRLGYSVTPAADGVEAMRLFQEQGQRFDIVLCDVVLPRMGGCELFQCARVYVPDVRFLFMSGYSADDDARPAHLGEPGVGFIAKPFSVEDLTACIRGLLRTGQCPMR